MAQVKGFSSNGYRTIITAKNRDITHSMLWFAIDASKKPDAVLPVWAEEFDGLGSVLNILSDAFARLKVEDILEQQIAVQVIPENPDKGKTGYMSILDDCPYLTFENTQGLLLPFGLGEHSNKLARTSFLEKLFASKAISLIESGSREETLSNDSSLFVESALGMYERYGMTELDFGQDLENAIRCGTVKKIETVLRSTGNTYSSIKRIGPDSWLV